MKISTKQDISNLAKGFKGYCDNEVGFPFKLSKAHDAVSILVSGLNHQGLIKALPYISSRYHVDELQAYLKQVHQKQLSDDQLMCFSRYELTEGLIYHNENLTPLIHGVSGNKANICITVYGSGHDAFLGDDDVFFDLDMLNTAIPVKATGGTLIHFGNDNIASYSFMERMSEVLADIDIDGSVNLELDGYAFNDIIDSLTSENKLNFIGGSPSSGYDDDEDSEESWKVRIPKFTLAGIIELSKPLSDEIYLVIDDESSLIQSLQHSGFHGAYFAEISISLMRSDFHGAYVDLNDSDEVGWMILGNAKRGSECYKIKNSDVGSSFGSDHRALGIIKNIVEKQSGLSALVPLSLNNYPVGALEITHPNHYKFVIPSYEDLYCDMANMSTSSHHFDGKDLQEILPGIKAYQVKANKINGIEIFLDSNSELSFFHDEQGLDVDSEFCEITPALYNAMSERINHWTLDDLSVDNIAYASDKTVFETHSEEFLAAEIDFILVDDFQELYGDLSSVMTVGFYKKSTLVAELSYSIILGARKDEELKEFMLDKAIKGFAANNNIPYRWHEHTVNHPYGERHLSHYITGGSLLPTDRNQSVLNSLMLVIIEVTLPVMNRDIEDIEQSMSKAHALIKPLLIDNVHKSNQAPEPFNFCSIQTPRLAISNDKDIDLMTKAFVKAHTDNVEKINFKTEVRLPDYYKTQLIYGAFDLKGKPFMETHS
ncbi:hypothetical protein LMH73_018360, partial [Vibrio splendidus]